jgi:beta-xylosidase
MYANPVLPGDFPDPSVTRVGSEYWAAATSSEWGPIFPLLHSADLVSWDAVGSVFEERPAWSVDHYWAPEIQEDRGQFYVFYAAHRRGGPLCVAVASADAPSGPYQDHGPLVCQEDGSIDPFSIRDERGVRHLVWKEDSNSFGRPTRIWAQELSDDGEALLGDRTELIRNDRPWEGDLVEGPFVLRRGDTFYLFYSAGGCCEESCAYGLGVARSTALLGPWEKDPDNPILTANAAWRCPGHGSITDDGEGRLFLLYHAYSTRDGIYVGRQGLLDEVVFGADGWPSIHDGEGPSSAAPAPIAPQRPRPDETLDEFTSATLGPEWQWLVAEGAPGGAVDPSNGGRLVLAAAPPVAGNRLGAALAQRTRWGDYEATTEVTADPGVSAGLAAVGDGDNALGISLVAGNAVVWRLANGASQSLAQVPAADRETLRMTAQGGHVLSFAIHAAGAPWVPVGDPVDSRAVEPDLPPWDRGVRIGLVASGPAGASARFEYLRVVEKMVSP